MPSVLVAPVTVQGQLGKDMVQAYNLLTPLSIAPVQQVPLSLVVSVLNRGDTFPADEQAMLQQAYSNWDNQTPANQLCSGRLVQPKLSPTERNVCPTARLLPCAACGARCDPYQQPVRRHARPRRRRSSAGKIRSRS